ncbi:MAG TPA: PRC-barrel domain-containing protein [Hyphomicrobiaceae bacterium]|jgi:sporulation protein YlmC with PRC-barrel domain|nr:PRC-barrel domain-containing protein [Hyphomicrobiaceae bacterium]
MKTPIVAMLAAVLMSSSALAQTTSPSPTAPSNAPAKTTPQSNARTETKAPTQTVKGAWNVKDFFRSNVYNTSGEKIGDITDLVVDENGKITAFIISVGGFLGLGAKDVSMPTDQLNRMIHSDGKTYFTVNATKEQLQAAPEYTQQKS